MKWTFRGWLMDGFHGFLGFGLNGFDDMIYIYMHGLLVTFLIHLC